MKLDNPRKTSSGCVHLRSARIVSPKERRGNAAVVDPFIGRRLLQWETLLSSTLPNCPERSRVHQTLPVLEYWSRCSRDNRCRNKPLSVARDRVLPFVSAIRAKKYGAHLEHGRASIRPAN